MVDLRPSTPDLLRCCSNVTSFPSEFFVSNSRARISDINDKRTELLNSEALSESQQEISTSFPASDFSLSVLKTRLKETSQE